MNRSEETLKMGKQDPEAVQSMFNEIAPTYDLLNHVLSFGLDIFWRKKAIRLLRPKKGGDFLDIAAGSGDLSFDALALQPLQIVATDFAVNMLRVLKDKASRRHNAAELSLSACDAMHMPFADGSFDVTMCAFGIRNFADRLAALKEMHRVLKPTGLALILELSVPANPFALMLYRLYTKILMPLVGKIISKHTAAYEYLPASIEKFPKPPEFIRLMEQAGLDKCKVHPLSFGSATIFVGVKPV